MRAKIKQYLYTIILTTYDQYRKQYLKKTLIKNQYFSLKL